MSVSQTISEFSESAVHEGVVISPMGVGEVLDAGIVFARRHYRTLALVYACVLIPANALNEVLAVAVRDLTGLQYASLQSLTLVTTALPYLLIWHAVPLACARLLTDPLGSAPIRPLDVYGVTIQLWAIRKSAES